MDAAAGALLDAEHAAFAKAVLRRKMKFLEMMDDDFNTAGAIAVMHELAGEINAFIERTDVEQKQAARADPAPWPPPCQTLRNLAAILGLFSPKPRRAAAASRRTSWPTNS